MAEKKSVLGAPAVGTHVKKVVGHGSLLSELSLMDWLSLVTGVVGLTATFIFGAWAIKSYDATQQSNVLQGQALSAQQDPSMLNEIKSNNRWLELNSQVNLALLCNNIDSTYPDQCAGVLAPANIASLASAITPLAGPPTTTTTPGAAYSGAPVPTSAAASSDATSTSTPSPEEPTLPPSSGQSSSSAPTSTSEAGAGASPQPVTPPNTGSGQGSGGSKLSLGGIIGIIVGSAIAATVALLVLLAGVRRKRVLDRAAYEGAEH